MAKGNPKAYLNSPMCDNSPVDKEENALMIQYALDIFTSKTPDLSKPEEVEQCIYSYFKSCTEKGLRPGNLGLYGCLGLDKKQVYDLLHGIGTIKKNASVKSVELIKKACDAIRGYREMLGSQGKLSPPVLIFWQKNFDGMVDEQKIDISTAQVTAERSPEEIAAQIASDIPVDSDYTEL